MRALLGNDIVKALPGGGAQIFGTWSLRAGDLVILRGDQVGKSRNVVNGIRGLSVVVSLVAIVLFGIAVALARGWRTTALMWAGICLAAVGGLVLLARKLLAPGIVNGLVSDPTYRPAGTAAWMISTTELPDTAVVTIVLGVVVLLVAVILRLAAGALRQPQTAPKRARERGILSDVQITSQHRQIIRDRAKRGIVDLAQRYVPRLQTPMTQLLGSLRARAMLPSEMTALELFGMHGLWHTRDYAPHCRSLEFYEIDPVFAAYAARSLPNAEVVVGDSIQAVRSGTLKRGKYTFIVLDNPSQSPYGNGYIEHFDLFPQILRYIDDGVLVLNFLLGVHDFSGEQARRRKEVYGTVRPSVDGAAAVYERHFREAQLDVPTFTYTSRNAGNGYLAFVCQRPAGAAAVGRGSSDPAH